MASDKDTIPQEEQTKFFYFNQTDPCWATATYAGETLAIAGCGPTCMAMVIKTLTGQKVDPAIMAAWAEEHGFAISGGGSYHALIPQSAAAFGLPVQGCNAGEEGQIADALASGKLVVMIAGPGIFTARGHFMVLRGINQKGEVLLADPISEEKSSKLWSLSLLLTQAKTTAGAGGPFWIIG